MQTIARLPFLIGRTAVEVLLIAGIAVVAIALGLVADVADLVASVFERIGGR